MNSFLVTLWILSGAGGLYYLLEPKCWGHFLFSITLGAVGGFPVGIFAFFHYAFSLRIWRRKLPWIKDEYY